MVSVANSESCLYDCAAQLSHHTFQSPALPLLRDLERDLDLDLEREAAGLSRLTLLSLRLTGQMMRLVSTM